jgi:polar amino acid transport system substrate-binding protein
VNRCGAINVKCGPAVALAILGALVAAVVASPCFAQARNDIVPDAWRGDVLRTKPDMHKLDKLRFVTDSDYPPFHYFDEEGVLTGFNVDLAKAICEALEVQCEVRPVEWEDLFAALDKDEADAAIASIRIDADTLQKVDMTDRYYATPARFIARKDSELKDIRPETVGGKKIAVVKGTGHEAYVRLYFPEAVIVSFDSAEEAQDSLKSGEVDLMFGDGIGLTFWLNGVTSNSCCEFRGGPYLDSRFFGEGVGIAVKKGNRKLVDILNYGLEQVHASGRFEGLFLRYFPMNFF